MGDQVFSRFVLIGVLVMAIPSAAQAQDEHRFEVSGGLSYLLADVDGTGLDGVGGVGLYGGIAFIVNDRIALGGEIAYNHNIDRLDVQTNAWTTLAVLSRPRVNIPQWTALFGPRVRIMEHKRIGFGVRAMAGIAHGEAEIELRPNVTLIGDELTIEYPGGRYKFTVSAFDLDFGTVFAASCGAYLDLRVSDGLVWHVIRPDVLITTYRDDVQTSLRIASGFGVRF
jgi:hypothetical protein